MYYIVYFIIGLMGLVSPALADDLISFTIAERQETIRLAVPEIAPRKIFTISNPDRLVVDVPVLAEVPDVSLRSGYEGNLIKGVRFGQFSPETSRFVFDLHVPVRVLETKEDRGALSIAIAADKTKSAGAREKIDKKPAAAKPKKKSKPVIVIDPGHGGVDPGAIGPKRTREKDIVLEYAKALRAKLNKSGRYKVVLTRDNDRFVKLRQRVAYARKVQGDIFISLHADSAPELEARGLSVYTVSEQASDREAEALAAHENKADVIAGMDLSEEREDVADILISLAQRETKNRSATLADFLVTRLDDRVRLLTNSHRFAGFAVLKAPDIPSVLVEIGFLSHPSEEKLLKSKAHRDKVVAGIASGIDAYFSYTKEMEGE